MSWARYVLVDQALCGRGMRSTECSSCLLFIIYFSYIASGVESQFSKFRKVDTFRDWLKDWQMHFKGKKCKVLGLGKYNGIRDYIMQGAVLEHVT